MNPPSLPWLSEISGALHLAQPGLMAGHADKIHVILNRLQTKIIDFPFSLTKEWHYYSSTNAFSQFFCQLVQSYKHDMDNMTRLHITTLVSNVI